MEIDTDVKVRDIRMSASVEFDAEPSQVEAAASEGGKSSTGLKSFRMLAYTGGAMNVGFAHPVVVDLAGMKVSAKPRPILLQHDPMLIVGHTENVEVKALHDRTELRVSGVISGAGPAAQDVIASSANGFPWQASIGANVSNVEFVDKGETAQANGRNFKGPVYIARASQLGEVSFVALGADDNTSASVAASAAGNEDSIMADMKAEATTAAPIAPAVDGAAVTAQIRAEAAAETARIASIRKVCAGRHGDIESKAIADGWDASRAELEVLRAERPVMGAPAIHASETAVTGEVIEAAVAMAGKLPGLEDAYGEKALEAASKRFKGGLGLQRLLLEAAWANGYSGLDIRGNSSIRDAIQAAFSNRDFSGILSNASNKFLQQGFTAVESVWRQISAIRPVSDFKTSNSYRLSGDQKFLKVAPDGEIKNATGAGVEYANKADTYGRMFSITRQDIINDDLGALTTIPQQIGRGAATGLNEIFWTAFLDNASFFTSGRGNYISGATTNLQYSSMVTAEQKFIDQTDPDGNPLGIMPKFLLVPSALKSTAYQLCNSLEVRDTTASKIAPTANPYVGLITPVTSAYLGNSRFTGYSATAWYLLADPADLATMEVLFLNGVEAPTVEEAEADFNVLGIQMRAYLDFGVAKHEYRAGVMSKGAA